MSLSISTCLSYPILYTARCYCHWQWHDISHDTIIDMSCNKTSVAMTLIMTLIMTFITPAIISIDIWLHSVTWACTKYQIKNWRIFGVLKKPTNGLSLQLLPYLKCSNCIHLASRMHFDLRLYTVDKYFCKLDILYSYDKV